MLHVVVILLPNRDVELVILLELDLIAKGIAPCCRLATRADMADRTVEEDGRSAEGTQIGYSCKVTTPWLERRATQMWLSGLARFDWG